MLMILFPSFTVFSRIMDSPMQQTDCNLINQVNVDWFSSECFPSEDFFLFLICPFIIHITSVVSVKVNTKGNFTE